MLRELNHPAVFQGAELFDRPDWEWWLGNDELDEIQRGCLVDPTPPLHEIPSTPWPEIASEGLIRKMHAIQDALENGSGAVVLRGLPIQSMSLDQAASVYWRLLSLIGTPVPQTAQGDRLFRVQDEGFRPDHPQARGPSSRNRLSFHSDRCDVIGFLCVRQAEHGGANQIVSAMTLYNQLRAIRPDLLEALCEPYWYRRHNVDPGNAHAFYQQPVFSFADGHFAASLLRVLIDRAYSDPSIGPMPERQAAALDLLQELAEDPAIYATYRQQPGDIMLLNNFVTFHRRDEFQDAADPDKKRLLLRLWLAVPNSRPLAHWFAAGYGATDAGAIRGGMRQGLTTTDD